MTSAPAPRSSARALLRYVVGWSVAGAVIAALALVLLRGGDDGQDVSVPPLEQTELAAAARAGGCEIRQDDGSGRLRPPVDGAFATAARPGIYDRTPSVRSLIGALRRGIIVIHYRSAVGEERVRELQELQRAVPAGTIVTRNEDMGYLIAVATWRRLLGCSTVRDGTSDAVQLFRGRYLGSGPDG